MLLILAGKENFSDAEIIGLKKQEQQEATQGVWIYEIPELQGMSKADVRHIKQFASRMVDSARPAYGHNRADLPRRCIFIATTNETAYLRDTTGNRRFLPVRLHGVIRQGDLMMVDLAGITKDRDQLWAEAAAIEAGGEELAIREALWAVAAIEQQKRMEPNPWADKLSSVLTKRMEEKPLSGKFAAHTDDFGNPQWRVESEYILTEVLDIPLDRQTSSVAKNLVEAMRSLDWHHNERAMRIGKVTTRGYSRLVGDDLCDVMTWAWMRYQQKAKGWSVRD